MSTTETTEKPMDLTRNLPDEVDLTDVEIHEGLSEETLCFKATLLLDGEEVGEVMNRGGGGPNRYDYFDRDDLNRLEAIAEDWLKNEHNEKASEPLGLLISQMMAERELRQIARRHDDRPVAIEVMKDWQTWNDSPPGSILGGQFREDFFFAVTEDFRVEQILDEQYADAYRIYRANE